MPIPAADIKNMPVKEKLRLIERLSKSVDKDIIETEQDAILGERIRLFEKGKLKFDSWENVKSRLTKKAALRNKKTA